MNRDVQGLNYKKIELLEYLLFKKTYKKSKKALGYTIPSEYLNIMEKAMKRDNKGDYLIEKRWCFMCRRGILLSKRKTI